MTGPWSCPTANEGRLEPTDQATSAQQLPYRNGTRMANHRITPGARRFVAVLPGGVSVTSALHQSRCLCR